MKRSLLLIALLPATALAQSGQTSSSITLGAVVEATCMVESTSSIVFGQYDPVNINRTLPARASGQVSVRCSNGTTNVQVALSQGQNPSSGSSCGNPLRNMRSSKGALLSYQVYQDVSETIVWGCSAATSKELPPFSSLSSVAIPTFGLVAAGQDAPQGSYNDMVEVSVTF